MSVSDEVFRIYQRFYSQKAVLSAAPALTINPDSMGAAEFPVDKALGELNAVAAYLLGLSSLKNIPFEQQVKIVKESYHGQAFWQELLFDYLSLKLDVEEAQLKQDGEELVDKIRLFQYEMNVKEAHQEDIINHYAEKIKKEKFHVDAETLVRNYMKMLAKDSKEAWKVLTTNPAYFSPIKVTDERGKQVLSPAQAIAENKRLAGFLKGLKG